MLGFDAVGIARADEPIALDAARWRAFVDAGMHGEMTWLAEHDEARARLDGDAILRGAKSVVCVARRYQRPPEDEARDAETARSIARYARGRDYHGFMRHRLRRLAKTLRSFGARARPLCDEEPLLERAWAVRAGVGFVGKNGMLIVPGIGSMVLLGEVVTTLDLEPDVPPAHAIALPLAAERCGSCTRCLDACPTRAFAAPFVLDPRRCVSYLTIEQRGAVPEDLREGVGAHLFGCDDCQSVCPFNAGAGARAPLDSADGDPFAPLEGWSRVALEDLLALDDDAWRALSRGSPIKRAGRDGIARNAALVLGNRGDARALPALRDAASAHPSAIVRESAAWAIARLEECATKAAPR